MHTLCRDHVMEKKVISKFYHEHPLILTKNVGNEQGAKCYGCRQHVPNTEMAYVCVQEGCSDGCILHKECGELPNQIWHPEHSKHPMNLFSFCNLNTTYDRCDLCKRGIYYELGYRCSICDFSVHRKCVEASIEARHELEHPSHPLHPLTLTRRVAFSFYCDGCSDEDVDMAYTCNICEFWLHKRCATSLPTILPVDEGCHDHHHQLSLVFSLPKKHCRYRYKCDVCSKFCDPSRWSYFCGECRYIVHIKCAIGSSTTKSDDSNLNEDGGDVIEFPLDVDDISHKLIKPFVMREKGLINTISTSSDTNTSYLLEYYHEHPLRYVSEFARRNDGDDEEEDIEESKICDVCITPITNSYYECATSTNCSYSIHSICSLLPHTLQHSSSSSSNIKSSLLFLGECGGIPNKNHIFTLIGSKGWDADFSSWDCNLCNLPTKGMGYECGDCGKKIDVKCASLPTTIRHASHTRCHRKPLILKPLILSLVSHTTRTHNECHVCNKSYGIRYYCSQGECDFSLHLRCAMLPLSIKYREWDKHPLLLTSDASLDHPSDFFCEFCEIEMHPKSWMYHCRHCDASFHLNYLDTASGLYRNMKFGRRYELDGIHPNHPLTFTCITLKKHCDLCHKRDIVYTFLGFECASCYYVVCENCGVKEYRKKKEMSLSKLLH